MPLRTCHRQVVHKPFHVRYTMRCLEYNSKKVRSRWEKKKKKYKKKNKKKNNKEKEEDEEEEEEEKKTKKRQKRTMGSEK